MAWAPRSRPSLALAAMAITMACGSASTAPTTTTGTTTADVPTATCALPVITNDPNLSVPPRCVVFAGRPWLVKSRAKGGVTSNAWSDLAENVSVDTSGLHLAITKRAQTWYAAEVTLNESLGYGTYSFRTSSRLDQLDTNAVLGMFTYDYLDPAASYRELDIEYSPGSAVWPGRMATSACSRPRGRGRATTSCSPAPRRICGTPSTGGRAA